MPCHVPVHLRSSQRGLLMEPSFRISQLTNLPSLMGIVTLAPIKADLTWAGMSSGPVGKPLSASELFYHQ